MKFQNRFILLIVFFSLEHSRVRHLIFKILSIKFLIKIVLNIRLILLLNIRKLMINSTIIFTQKICKSTFGLVKVI